jgi:hypothetical protein
VVPVRRGSLQKMRHSGRPTSRGTSRGAAATTTARDRSLRRDVVVLVVVCVGLTVAWPLRLMDNPELPSAVELTARMDEVFFGTRDGDELPTEADEVAAGIRGARVEVGGRTRWVLAGRAGIDCYVLWWDDDGVRRGRTLQATVPCEPSTTATSTRPEHVDRTTSAERDIDADYDWGPVLPDAVLFRVWFLPSVLLAGAVGLGALVRISIVLLTGKAPSELQR